MDLRWRPARCLNRRCPNRRGPTIGLAHLRPPGGRRLWSARARLHELYGERGSRGLALRRPNQAAARPKRAHPNWGLREGGPCIASEQPPPAGSPAGGSGVAAAFPPGAASAPAFGAVAPGPARRGLRGAASGASAWRAGSQLMPGTPRIGGTGSVLGSTVYLAAGPSAVAR